MLICGIKATHDGGVAVIDGNRLVCSVEVEKLDNRPRYSPLEDVALVEDVLRAEGIGLDDVDSYVVDGWWAREGEPTAHPTVLTANAGAPLTLPVAPYLDGSDRLGPLRRHRFDTHSFSASTRGYASYFHASNHLLGSYCSSPFAAAGEDALVLVWDGGMTPRLYEVRAGARTVRLVSSLFPVPGNHFADFSSHFGPFQRDTDGLDPEAKIAHHLSVAGKAMAYAALGKTHEDAYQVFDRLFDELETISPENAFTLGRRVAAERQSLLPGLSDADIISTFQDYLGEVILQSLQDVASRLPTSAPRLLCLAGGCALNIKWNSRIRSAGLFEDVWVPPFANDSGAALGTAACEMFAQGGHTALSWDVYSGPALVPSSRPEGWSERPCDERQLAALLHEQGQPVLVLSGRAEIGPRALGNRSILAPATNAATKSLLNTIKDRADYRPVAPVCLESRASEVFDPGGRDEYMLFEHRMRPGWAERVPAVVHLDGTARLQTLGADCSSVTRTVLEAYEELTGIPVLCNTSANLNGSGFFPDVSSAARWGGTTYIWSEGRLYEQQGSPASGSTRPS